MAKRKCPGCGTYFLGKRCPECYYTPFETDISPSFHQEERSSERPRPQGRRPAPGFRAGKLFIIAWVVIFSVLIVGTLTSIIAGIRSTSYMEMEVIALPEDGLTLYDDDGIQVILGWNGGQITGDIPVYLVNNSSRDIYACTGGVAVNGCMVDAVFFYCEAGKNSTAMSQLWIDTAYLQTLGIPSVRDITLQLSVVDDKDYTQLNPEGEYHTFGPGGDPEIPVVSGKTLYQSEDMSLIYQGVHKDEYGLWNLRLYLQNHSGETLVADFSELIINGEEMDQYLYQSLFPHTYAVLDRELYRADALQLTSPEDVRTVEFDLTVSRYGESYSQETEHISVTID